MRIINYIWLAIALSIAAQASAQSTKPYSWNNLPKATLPSFKADTFNIVNYGAKQDGIALNTIAINKAVSACEANGGGVVLIPEGIWMTGPIVLKSNVNLHITRAAILQFTPDKTQYPLVEGTYEGKAAARNQSPISAMNARNIAITGSGVIDGNGDVWRAVGKSELTERQWKEKLASGGVLSADGKEWYPSEQYRYAKVNAVSMLLGGGKDIKDFAYIKDFLRPNLLVFTNCKQILLEGVTFQNSPAWCLHPLLCEDLTIRKVLVKNPSYAQNGDGIDIESCRNFLVEDCVLDVGDDAICIKSGKDEEGRRRGKPTENGLIRNNLVYSGHGGFVIGSEMSGGARNIFIENCSFMGTDKGLRFKSVRGRGGLVENIYARNIFMTNIVQEAIFFDMFYFVKFATDGAREMKEVVNEGTPIFRNMVFDNIVCTGANKSIFIRGLAEMPIQNIVVKNSRLSSKFGVEFTDASKITLDNVQLHTEGNKPLISVENSSGLLFKDISSFASNPTFLTVSGGRSAEIIIKNVLPGNLENRIILNDPVKKGSVIIR
ncbi:MAG: glycoside hydrolase family 28 protein [Sphingobacteriales bacterium]|nr:MAG: glycoside hydrolase family 28 protein [Sphingobacteriales bacterium]